VCRLSQKKIVLQRAVKHREFITGQNEREETTQDAIVTKSAAFASYEKKPAIILTIESRDESRGK
jgi:hypothetical protein